MEEYLSLILSIKLLSISSFALIATGVLGHLFLFGSVLSFKNDAVLRKENGLLFCYICDHQIDPKANPVFSQRLDDLQSLIGFPCGSCRFINYFPVAPFDLKRALFGKKSQWQHTETGRPLDKANLNN